MMNNNKTKDNNHSSHTPNQIENKNLTSRYINVGTINIRGLNDINKQHNLINECMQYNLDIVAI